jgi:hypothetical protein
MMAALRPFALTESLELPLESDITPCRGQGYEVWALPSDLNPHHCNASFVSFCG